MIGTAIPLSYNTPMRGKDEFPRLPENLEAALRAGLSRPGGFHNHLGIRLAEARRGWARLEMTVAPTLINVFGQVHGGALFSLVDTAMGAALAGCLEPGDGMATLEAKINFIHPLEHGVAAAEAALLHHGRRTAVLEARVFAPAGEVLAHALGTYMILKSPG